MSDLWAVLRARSHCQLSVRYMTLAEAQADAEAWMAAGTGPAVVVPEAAAKACRVIPDTEELAERAEAESYLRLLRLLHRNLPFTPTQPGGVPGTTYLICFDRHYQHAHHYLGWSEHPDAREAAHAAGQGSRLMAVVTAAGIPWRVVRTWPGTDRYFERMLKVRNRSPRLCPRCSPGNNRGIPLTVAGAVSPMPSVCPSSAGRGPGNLIVAGGTDAALQALTRAVLIGASR